MATNFAMFLFVMFFVKCGFVCGTGTVKSDTYLRHEKYLLDKIRDVPHYVIPHDENGPIAVRHMVSLNRIIHVDATRKTLELGGWEMMAWIDKRLAWEDDEFITVDQIIVPVELVWRPDIVLYNGDGTPTDFGQYFDQKVHISKNGTVWMIKPLHQKSLCKQIHPYISTNSHVTCELVFGSWNYDLQHMELVPESTSVFTAFAEPDFNQRWSLVSSICKQNNIKGVGMYDFTMLTYSVELKYVG